jgi:hypothetical protein
MGGDGKERERKVSRQIGRSNTTRKDKYIQNLEKLENRASYGAPGIAVQHLSASEFHKSF